MNKNNDQFIAQGTDIEVYVSLITDPNYGLVVRVTAFHEVGGFASRPGHTKNHHKIGTNCFPAWHACFRVGV